MSFPRVFLVLVLLTFLFFLPAATMQGVFFFGDAQDYASRLAYSAERLRAGEFATWNPYLSLGNSQIGDPAGMAAYLPALLLFLILPLPIAFNYTLILHALLAASGMFLLAARWGQSRAAGVMAALVYAFGGFVVAHVQHLNILVGLAWLPWIVYCIERVYQTRRASYLGLGGAALGLQILGGHTQIVLYSAVVWGTYAVVCLARAREGGRREILKGIAGLGLMVACGSGLAAIFLVPFVELLNTLGRVGTPSYEFATILSLEPARLVTLVYPYFLGGNFGSPERGPGFMVEMSPYVGVLPLALAGFAFTRPNWRVYWLGALVVAGVMLALGGNTPLYPLVYRLPLFGTVRAPARFLLLFVFGVALLAGYGLDALRNPGRNVRVATAIGIGLGILSIASFSLLALPRLVDLPRTIDRAFTNPAFLVACALITASTSAWWMWAHGIFSGRARVVLTLSLVFVDLAYYGANFTLDRLVPASAYFEPAKNIAPLLNDRTTARVFYWTRGDLERADQYDFLRRLEQSGRLDEYLQVSRGGVRQSLPMRFGLYSMQGYKSETPYHAPLLAKVDVWEELTAERLGLIGTFGAKYVLTTREIHSALLTPIAGDAVNTYENALALPRAFVVPEGRVVDNSDRALEELSKPDFDPRRTVLLQTAVALPQGDSSAEASSAVRWELDAPERIVLEVETGAPGFLILNDTFYPGWRASVDGVETPIYRANVIVRAVALGAGTHRVEFVYEPSSVRLGGIISALSSLGLGVFLSWQYRRGRRRGRVRTPQ